MPSRDPIQRFEDILTNIELITAFTDGMDGRSFAEDAKTSNAVERCLERISEAARKLGAEGEQLCPDVPWAQMRALGNLLRHEYDQVDSMRLWLLIEEDLPGLKAAVERTLKHRT